jgi:hypothetical protein
MNYSSHMTEHVMVNQNLHRKAPIEHHPHLASIIVWEQKIIKLRNEQITIEHNFIQYSSIYMFRTAGPSSRAV